MARTRARASGLWNVRLATTSFWAENRARKRKFSIFDAESSAKAHEEMNLTLSTIAESVTSDKHSTFATERSFFVPILCWHTQQTGVSPTRWC